MGLNFYLFFFLTGLLQLCITGAVLDKKVLKQQAHEMFMHGYRSYMNYAYPADELMPLSCKGRIRGVTPSRGDIDDSLGNFSLTLIDSLDTLVVLNEFDEFEKSVQRIINDVQFNSDLIVSVFETNIRVLGGLLSGHLMSELVKGKFPSRMTFYNGQLLTMALEVGNRLLPAFNTSSGLPYSRISLRHGMLDHLKRQKDTCTACGGTMLLEMAALSRLTGDPIFEEKAKKAMDFLWAQRHRSSDLMGTVLNVHSGDWVRRESGIGAGIDSYYEYCLKAYILLGDRRYLERFNRHYDAIMRYVSKGPLFVDVHMHRPTVATRGFMDSLLAFWPGLQVLKGDVKQAIEMHEMLFQVIQKHKFLPEAFTHDFQVHWAEHPLRPEFVESTYFLYRATKDPHYLEVAKQVMDSINEYVRVPCGFASIKDVRTMSKEDQMESFVLSETFKYLYLIFAEPSDLIFEPDNYVLTTEAHFLPLSMGQGNDENEFSAPRRMMLRSDDEKNKNYVCANPLDFNRLPTEREEALLIRERTQNILSELRILQATVPNPAQPTCETQSDRLRAWAFSANNKDHLTALAKMGIEVVSQDDGRFYLSHQAAKDLDNACDACEGEVCTYDKEPSKNKKDDELSGQVLLLVEYGAYFLAFVVGLLTVILLTTKTLLVLHRMDLRCKASQTAMPEPEPWTLFNLNAEDVLDECPEAANAQQALWGSEFMQEMIQLVSKMEHRSPEGNERYVQMTSLPHYGSPVLMGYPAQFGTELLDWALEAGIAMARPFRACSPITNTEQVRGKIAIVERSDCMFQEKARAVQIAGAVGVIVVDHEKETRSQGQPSFAMAGDKDAEDDIAIPAVFLYRKEGETLMQALSKNDRLVVRIGIDVIQSDLLVAEYLRTGVNRLAPLVPKCIPDEGDFIILDADLPSVIFNVRFGRVTTESDAAAHQEIVERHVSRLEELIDFELVSHRAVFFNLFRTAAYGALGLNTENEKLVDVEDALRGAHINSPTTENTEVALYGDITTIRCLPRKDKLECTKMAR